MQWNTVATNNCNAANSVLAHGFILLNRSFGFVAFGAAATFEDVDEVSEAALLVRGLRAGAVVERVRVVFDVLVAALGVVLLRLAVLEADFDVFDTFS